MKKPLVSVIIPCYNYAQYIEQAINSVFNQTYKNVEVIVINDGSTDSSHEVISALQNKYKFQYIKQENQGIIATRNKGIELAKGEYLIQLDADDWLEKTYVKETLDKALEEKVEIVYTQARIFGRLDFVTNNPEFNLEYLKHSNYIHASALVHKRVFVQRRYDKYLDDKGNEDWDLFLDACLDGAEAALVNKTLLNYRKHLNSASRADRLESTVKEVLVRHHVLNKQNFKHPSQLWYFSEEINLLKNTIGLYEQNEAVKQELVELQNELETTKRRLNSILESKSYKVYKTLRKIIMRR